MSVHKNNGKDEPKAQDMMSIFMQEGFKAGFKAGNAWTHMVEPTNEHIFAAYQQWLRDKTQA